VFLYVRSQDWLLNLDRVAEVRLEGSALVFLLDRGAVRVDLPTPEEARGVLEALATDLAFHKRLVPLRERRGS